MDPLYCVYRNTGENEMTNKIKTATNLDELLTALREIEHDARNANQMDADVENILYYEYGTDICELPNFGGEEIEDTAGVWAWDKDRLLVGEGPFASWEIIARADY